MLRLAVSRFRVPRATTRLRGYSTAPGPKKDSPAVIALTFGFLAAGASGFYFVSQGGQTGNVPAVRDGIDTSSPVGVLDLKTVNAKIRQEASTFAFDAHHGKGRVDLVRVASNNPVEDRWDLALGKGLAGNKTLFAGVYDGHAGWATAAVLKQALIPFVSKALQGASGEAEDAVKTAFTQLDDEITANATKALNGGYEPGSGEVIAAVAPAIAGSCALLTMYDTATSVLRTAVTGDSRAVLGSFSGGKYTAEALSADQTGFNEAEVKRISAEHPGEAGMIDPKTGRLFGIAVTRGFGDHRWKWTEDAITALQGEFYAFAPRPKYKTPPYMTARPEVTTKQVNGEDFVILASDGLWDVMSNEDAVACVSRWVAAKRAGKVEDVRDAKSDLAANEEGWPAYKATPEHFAIEDLDNAAVCLVKNALGGSRRELLRGSLTAYSPLSRTVRDDITVQVIFFKEP